MEENKENKADGTKLFFWSAVFPHTIPLQDWRLMDWNLWSELPKGALTHETEGRQADGH